MRTTAIITQLLNRPVNHIAPEGEPVVGVGLRGSVLIFPNEAVVEISSAEVHAARAALAKALRMNLPKPDWTSAQIMVHHDRLEALRVDLLNAVADCYNRFGVHLEGHTLAITKGRYAA